MNNSEIPSARRAVLSIFLFADSNLFCVRPHDPYHKSTRITAEWLVIKNI